MALSIAEVLEEVAITRQEKIKREVLKKNESWSLRALLQQNFHPDASWLIPPELHLIMQIRILLIQVYF